MSNRSLRVQLSNLCISGYFCYVLLVTGTGWLGCANAAMTTQLLRSAPEACCAVLSAVQQALPLSKGMQSEVMFACSANANAALTKKLSAAERILKLGELCRKLETEQEKVLPFCTPQEALGLGRQQEGGPAQQQSGAQQEALPSGSEASLADSISIEESDQQVSQQAGSLLHVLSPRHGMAGLVDATRH